MRIDKQFEQKLILYSFENWSWDTKNWLKFEYKYYIINKKKKKFVVDNIEKSDK